MARQPRGLGLTSMNAWVAVALELVPREKGDQNLFRMVLSAMLKNALGKKPENPRWSVADVAAVAAKRANVRLRYDHRLLAMTWPEARRANPAAKDERW
jgi:hypothetical protein